ncbi:MAG: hypothetical protein JW801_06190 [Bacteroidales bacterium]|nr:hypothetical protein [Bacteroidales bacterium]
MNITRTIKTLILLTTTLLTGILFLPGRVEAQRSLQTLSSPADFEKLSGLPLSDKYGQVLAVKILWDLKKEELHFINANYFTYHHEFCNYQQGYTIELEYFNEVNYSEDPRRRYLLGNINLYRSLNAWALEISPVDNMPVSQIIFLYEKVAEASFIGDSLKFLMNSSRLQQLRDELTEQLPLISPGDIYRNLDFQAIGKFKAYGVLKFIENQDSMPDDLGPMDIIVLRETPLYLPRVAGILVTEFQTPLSHLTILGQNRKIPIAAYKNAFQDSTLRQLQDQKVLFSVLSDSFSIEPVAKLRETVKPAGTIRLRADLSVDTLTGVEYLDKKAFLYAGNKASNFGLLYRISQKGSFKTPESAFVIPFAFYDQHIINSGAGALIEELLAESGEIHQDSLKVKLTAIRNQITQAPMDEELLQDIKQKILSFGSYTKMRFRSSTNAEDAKGFSGAGLYTSKTGIVDDPDKTVEKAVRKVWASLWSYEAYSEREYFNIDHHQVFMGILVHRAFPDEEVNGVAITKNLYRPDAFGFVVNAQLGDESVVKPEQGNQCDQFICYPDGADNIYEGKRTVDIISFSNLNEGKLVMTDSEIQLLANELDRIKKYFMAHSFSSTAYLDFGLDVEFKLDGHNRQLYIKQVRYYND